MDIGEVNRFMTSILGPPFEWCPIFGGEVMLEDATMEAGSKGGCSMVLDFWMAKFPVTNDQYQVFLADPNGFSNPIWWDYSPQGRQWRLDHPRARPTAFNGERLPRTRVSWFDGMAFCAWLSDKCQQSDIKTVGQAIRLPSEQEWQRAAVGDSGWLYTWGNELDASKCNFGNLIGQPTPVDQPWAGGNPFGVADMIGNVWEWCLNAWGQEEFDLSSYAFRSLRGGAWNISNPAHLRAASRNCHPPRGQLNDAGFRILMELKNPSLLRAIV